ncbi:putative antitoxin RelB2 [Candidatus Kuenenia stuttgartiensis]|jgi:hypothetical protein|uniref:Putative antitoxin RelB2 n=1 Tax=Kuenenia stuttgartiensis TaxID=174633 RepID=Q1PVU5_KUEST|nr:MULTISPECIES: hypothetical protein [Kuenenia]MBE7546060.1 hypothetical protein [Planctomycetia bacterium]MBZ0192589.1 hypothetical protein [Candidatus Kuenenia stuttgartiensis]MCL4728495.1 hypothetical protein [Candidatus Kuenenia stuttgartiensis]MCZ7621384.1 hypothetical protein [Candidatus Kuenenia sp.]QII14170.1 putative antitoxin RelB2 [Candidatus Kuenenia stuttgartiensis]
MKTKTLPFAKEFITDSKGHITKIIMDFDDYQRFLDWVEDEGLVLAMNEVENEASMSLEKALNELEKK